MNRNSNTVFAGLCTIGLMAQATYSLARNPVVALFAASFGAGPEAIGFAVGASTITGIFVKMPAGVLSDVIGRTRTLMFSLAFSAVIPFAYLFVYSYWMLVVVRFLHGLSTATFNPVVMAVVVEIAGKRRAEMLSWFTSLTFIGTLIGPPLGGFLLTELSGAEKPGLEDFHAVYKVVAGLGISALIGSIFILRSTQEPLERETPLHVTGFVTQLRMGFREILMDRSVLLTSNMVGILSFSIGALEAFLPIYAVMILGYSEFYAGLLWGVQILMTILSKPAMGMVSDRHGRKPLLFWGMWVVVIPFMLIPWVSAFSLLVFLTAVYGLGRAMVTSSAAALVADLCRKETLGSCMGSYGTILDIGHAAGPILGGILIGFFGGQDFRAPFAIIALALLASAFAFNSLVRSPIPVPVTEVPSPESEQA